MIKRISPAVLCGTVNAIPSKSHVQRLLIAAALSDKPCRIGCRATSEDIDATVRCLRALGAEIERTEGGTSGDSSGGYFVTPIPQEKRAVPTAPVAPVAPTDADVGASGATLRFLLPVAAALGQTVRLIRRGRLPERPITELTDTLSREGVRVTEEEGGAVRVSGRLSGTVLHTTAKASSQFASGLLFALAVSDAEERRLFVDGRINSAGYIDMTAAVLRQFSLDVTKEENPNGQSGVCYVLRGELRSPAKMLTAEGDWSAASAFLCAGAIGSAPVSVAGVSGNSTQPDRAVVRILSEFGASVTHTAETYTVAPGSLYGIDINISGTPDLLPVLSVVAACAEGKTTVRGIARLRKKESDRVESVCRMLASLGADAEVLPGTGSCAEKPAYIEEETDDDDICTCTVEHIHAEPLGEAEDVLLIHGTGISGGNVRGMGDHRIVMAAAIASAAAADDILIDGADAVAKSYPDFFADLSRITLDLGNAEAE